MKTFVESQFDVIYVYEFQKTANPDEVESQFEVI